MVAQRGGNVKKVSTVGDRESSAVVGGFLQ